MNRKPTLKQYLLLVLAGFTVLMTLCFGLAITQVYDWGLDDSAEFYLINDLQDYRRGVAFDGSTYRRFYDDFDTIPQEFQYLFVAIEDATLLYHEGEATFSYLLPVALDNSQPISKSNLLVAIHTFPYEADEQVVGISLSELIVGLFFVAVAFMLLFSSLIYRSITMPVSALYLWAKDATTKNNAINHQLDPDALRFSELSSVGAQLNETIQHIVAITEREKSFVSSLSHELRTPMAIVSAALDLLERRDFNERGFDARDTAKLDKIRRANQRMTDTADTLLRIWQGKLPNEEPTEISLFLEVETIIKDSQVLLGQGSGRSICEIDNQIDPTLLISTSYQSLLIVLNNLIKNALQYAGAGPVVIRATPQNITISNPIIHQQSPQQANDSGYGFGLGLFIAEQVVAQQDWRLNTRQNGQTFVAEIAFNAG